MPSDVDLSEAGLEELVRLRAAASPGPWTLGEAPHWDVHAADGTPIQPSWFPDDARLIAASVNALLPLVEEVRRLRTEVSHWRETHGHGQFVSRQLHEAALAEQVQRAEDAETQCSSMVSARDLTIRDLRTELQTARSVATQAVEAVQEKLSASERAREEMAEALARYGEHDGDCAASVIGCAGDTVCTCGYDAALSSAAERKP